MDRARRFFEKINLPRLSLPRRDLTLSDKFIHIVSDLGDRLLSRLDQIRLRFKRFLRKQTQADWKARVEKLSYAVTRWLAHPVVPRHLGLIFIGALMSFSLVSGVFYGKHLPKMGDTLVEFRDDLVNLAGFRLETIKLHGGTFLAEAEIRQLMDLKPNASLMYLDINDAKAKLAKEPWIAEVSLKKNLPNELEVTISERKPAALWQYQNKITTIAADGTILLHEIRPQFKNLPLLVGKSGDQEAKVLLEALDTFPEIKEKLRAAVFVAERSWRLAMKNGLEIKLPEKDLLPALGRLIVLEKEQNILTRDIAHIDIRLADRTTIRLNEIAYEARSAYIRDRAPLKAVKEKSL